MQAEEQFISRERITKLAIVGCSRWDRNRINRLQKKFEFQLPVVIRFFDNPEVAKTWLVSEK